MAENTNKQAQTRARLLKAAGEIFAEHGFRNATVRDICRRARANVAAINYHFGDKETLYAEVIKNLSKVIQDKYSSAIPDQPAISPFHKLKALIFTFIKHITEDARPAWQGQLMAREMTDPTVALEKIIKETMRPFHDNLREVIRQLLPSTADETETDFCIASIIGQCLFYHRGRAALTRILPGLAGVRDDAEKIAEHIARFSIGGIGSRATAKNTAK